MNASRMVASALLGTDCVTVIVAGKAYTVFPPTVYRLAGAGQYLSDFDNSADTVAAIFKSINRVGKLASALSWLIKGDDSLSTELGRGTVEELCEALGEAYSLLSVENFYRLSTLARNVSRLIAKPK